MWILMTGVGIVVLVVGVMWYVYVGQYVTDYRKAKKEIFLYVESYKRRCTNQNRFVVTVESLQDSFREYDIQIIKKVWLELIKERIIEQDNVDNEWCIK